MSQPQPDIPAARTPRPTTSLVQQELFLLRRLYRAASAHLAAPYLEEHRAEMVEACKDIHDFKTGSHA